MDLRRVMPAARAVHMAGVVRLDRDGQGLARGRRGGLVRVPMAMVVAVMVNMACGRTNRPALRLERRLGLGDDQMLPAQHLGQIRIGLELQQVRLQFQRHMSAAEVVGRTQQVERRAMLATVAHLQHRLGGGSHSQQRAVLGHQHVTTAQRRIARQHDADLAAGGIGGREVALATRIPVELEDRGPFDEYGGEAGTAGNAFGGLNHAGSVHEPGRKGAGSGHHAVASGQGPGQRQPTRMQR
mmetsp:Transcript_69594/g.163652  ORF Transcript_69594/g.163652 Transcript_69594/m.163652 type:complete len:241 (+) Transcript_69594:853-1575(+)